jgi:Domain of unknown function (DUF5666)/Domain of unknown function (DUF4382)
MRQAIIAVSVAVVLTLMLAGCGSSISSSSTGSTSGASAAPVSISIHDTPPANVNILQFKIQITAAMLQPADTTQPPVNMLRDPDDVELIHLQTESALLANRNVPAGQYTGLTVTFNDPRIVIFNESNQTLTVGAESCAPMAVCKLDLPLNQMSVSVQAPTSPFPVMLSATSPLALLLHFDVNASVQGDLSVTPMVNLTQLPVPPNAAGEHTHILGVVTAVSSPTFTVQSVYGGTSSTITTDSNTMYHFGDSCQADNFSCIMVGQLVKVKVNVMSDGTLDATDVRLLENQGLPAFLGTIIGVNAAQDQIQVVLAFAEGPEEDNAQTQEASSVPSLTVQLSSSTTFSVDSDDLTLPAGVSFAGPMDLLVGQTVKFQPMLPITGTPPNLTVGASSVQLEPSQITATVSAVNAQASPPNFILGSLPPLFTGAGIMQIQVDAVLGTVFDDATGVGSLSPGQTVSVSALLFNTTTQPTGVATGVKLRHADD